MNPQRPRLETIAVIALLLLLGYAAADLSLLSLREKFLPGAPPTIRQARSMVKPYVGKEKYQTIVNRNIFSSDQKIADPIGGSPLERRNDGQPVPTQLPLALIGTLVHSNPARSVATINMKSKNDVIAIRVDGEMPDSMGTITKIERAKVVFRNNGSGRLEYIELKEETAVAFGVTGAAPDTGSGITAINETDRTVKRDEIRRHLENLPAILQQARAVPRVGANGQVECWSIADLQAGSVLETLGVRRGDCIETVNGERIDSPAKAMAKFQELRDTAEQINLGVERGGQKTSLNFSITQ